MNRASTNASNPRLKRHYSIIAHSPDVVELRHGTWNPVSFTLRDDSGTGSLLAVLSKLDGTQSLNEIARGASVPKNDVEALIDQLSALQLLENGASHAVDYFLDHAVPNLALHEIDRISTQPVTVMGDGNLPDEVGRILLETELLKCDVQVDDGSLRAKLSRSGIDWVNDALEVEKLAQRLDVLSDRFVIAARSTVDPIEMRAFNRLSLHRRIPWLHAAIDGPFLLIGPTVIPHRTACYECLESRILMNLREVSSYRNYKQALANSQVTASRNPLEPVLRSMVASHVAFEAVNYLLTGTSFTVGKMLAIYLPTFEISFNEVLRVASCPACGSNPERHDRELYFDIRALFNSNGSRNPES